MKDSLSHWSNFWGALRDQQKNFYTYLALFKKIVEELGEERFLKKLYQDIQERSQRKWPQDNV